MLYNIFIVFGKRAQNTWKGNNMSENNEARNKGKARRIAVLKCDSCGKENRIRESYLYHNELDAVNNNTGCYCSKCDFSDRKGFSYTILAGEYFTVFPKVISMKEYQELQEGVERAKEILRHGLEQLKTQAEQTDKVIWPEANVWGEMHV